MLFQREGDDFQGEVTLTDNEGGIQIWSNLKGPFMYKVRETIPYITRCSGGMLSFYLFKHHEKLDL